MNRVHLPPHLPTPITNITTNPYHLPTPSPFQHQRKGKWITSFCVLLPHWASGTDLFPWPTLHKHQSVFPCRSSNPSPWRPLYSPSSHCVNHSINTSLSFPLSLQVEQSVTVKTTLSSCWQISAMLGPASPVSCLPGSLASWPHWTSSLLLWQQSPRYLQLEGRLALGRFDFTFKSTCVSKNPGSQNTFFHRNF